MKTVACLGVAFSLFAIASCASTLRPCDRSNYPVFDRGSLIREVTLAETKRDWLAEMQLETLPPEAQAGVIRFADESLERFRAKTLPSDELWRYRYEKCLRCGWYTEGIVALRGSCIVAELTMKDDM